MISGFESELQDILNDRTSGSKELQSKLNSYFYTNFLSLTDIPTLLQLLKKEFITFQSIQSYLDKLLNAYNEGGKELFYKYIRKFISSENEIYTKLYEKLLPEINRFNKFITLSNSKTLFEVFKILQKKKPNLEVIISESRPQSEGKFFAEKLLSIGISVHLITEAMLPDYVQYANAAIVGADAILKNRNIVNKTGSKLLAITCNYYKKPFFVVADKTKKKTNNEFLINKENSSEIWNFQHPKLHIKNYYFELIEKKLITKIITD